MTVPNEQSSRPLVAIAGIVAVSLGILTLISGGAVLFGGEEARTAAGHVVDFVLWFNFASGIAYVGVGVGLLLSRSWSARASVYLALAIVAVGAAFTAHVLSGGLFEGRTAAAMSLRAAVWIVIAIIACRAFTCFGPHRTV